MKLFNKINKAIATTVLSTGILATSVVGTNLINNARDYSVYAAPYGSQVISKIQDNEFENFSGTTYGTPSTWDVAEGSDTANSDRFVSGIMDLSSSKAWSSNYEENFHMSDSDNPSVGITNKKFLYINNYSTSLVKYGYASDPFTLSKGGYYKITANIRTIDSGLTSLYITGLTDEVKMENINTSGDWKEYSFYISTNSISDASDLKLEIWLGSKTQGTYGGLFVDKVEVRQYDESTFKGLGQKDSATSIYTDLNNEVIVPFANAGFESDLTGWKLSESNSNNADDEDRFINVVKVGPSYNTDLSTTWNTKNPDTINTFNNERALLIVNKTSQVSGVESANITIKQHGFYRLSVWAYSDCQDGEGATILVKQVTNTESFPYSTVKCGTSATSNLVNSNWTEYSVYIQGSAYSDTQVNLGLFLGAPAVGTSEAIPTTGYVYFDEVRLQEISYGEYSSATSSLNNAGELNITSPDTSYIVPNNSFNKTRNIDNNITYPLAPLNFTSKVLDIDGNVDNQAKTYSGVVNVNTDHWESNKSHYPSIVSNPGTFNNLTTDESTNNVLMIGSENHIISQTYTSESITLEASSFYKVSYRIKTQLIPEYNGGARVEFLSSSKYIDSITNYNTHDTWELREFYIKTGLGSLSCTFELGLDYTIGAAFFDELHVEKFESEDAFNSVVTSSDKVYDLTYETFDTENTYAGYFDSINISESDRALCESGIKEYNGNNVLYISSMADTYYTFSSGNTFSLSSGSYYSISVDIYTDNLYQEIENRKYDDDNNELPYGVSIALKNSSASFTHKIENINTKNYQNGTNKFTTYTFYIHANESVDTYLYLSLGNIGSYVSGTVYFDNVRFNNKLTEEEYNEAKNNDDIQAYSLFIEDTSANNVEAEEPEEEVENEEKEPFEFPWILVSSIITGVAILVAIIGYFIRKVRINRAPKIKTTYDRRKTLDVEMDRRERIALRQSMIEELKLQLHTIDDEIESIKEMFEVKEAQILLNIKARREQIAKDKAEIAQKRESAQSEYKSILSSEATDKEKQLAERHFARYIAKLNKQEESLQKLLDQKETSSALLKLKREQQLQKFLDAQVEIQKEIARIEEEIEQIAKEDEQVWAEYRKAKQEAKEAKTAYIQEKKITQAKEKAAKKTAKSDAKTTKSEPKTKKSKEDKTSKE